MSEAFLLKWKCSICGAEFTSHDLVPDCPECEATEDDIEGIET